MIQTFFSPLSTIFDNMLEGVIVADLNGNFLVFNRPAETILGLGSMDVSPSEWIPVYGCYKSDGKTPYKVDELPLIQATKGISVQNELMLIKNVARKKGAWINISGFPIKDDQEELVAAAVIFRDISYRMMALDNDPTTAGITFESFEHFSDDECKACLEFLANFGSKYNLLANAVEETDDSILITDAQGSIIYVNSGFEKTTGYKTGEVLGQNPNILKSGYHDAAFYQSLWNRISGGNYFRGTILNKKKSGDLYWSEQTITPIKNEFGEITNYVSVLKDITDLRERQRLEREIELAAEIQMNVIPEILPTLPGFEFGARIIPARVASGDFYDIIQISETKVGILIGDVVDKGIPAGMLMSRVHALISTGARRHESPRDIIMEVNKHFSHFKKSLQFTTVLYGVLDCESGEFSYARAGHEAPCMLFPDGSVQLLPHQLGMVLGLYLDIVLDEQTITIPPGATMLLYTDGVLDCIDKDKNTFGLEGIQESLSAMVGLSAQGICDRMIDTLTVYQGLEKQYDDIALVAIQAVS